MIVGAAMILTIVHRPAVLVSAGDNTLPPDLKPMLEHAAIVEEMMHACCHARSDLAVQLGEEWAAWWTRNATLQQALAALRKDAARGESKEDAPNISPAAASAAQAGEILNAYRELRRLLRRQVEEQVQLGNMKFVGNCDDVLAKLAGGRLDYRPPGN
jgi:hypothetical protein